MKKIIFLLFYYLSIKNKYKIKECPICQNGSFKNFKFCREGLLVFRLIQCKNCGHIMQSPQLKEKFLNEYYKSYYRFLKKSPINLTQFERGKRRGKGYLKIFSRNKINIDRKSVLEIGCGQGGILESFKEMNCDVTGVEWDIECKEYGKNKGLRIYDDILSVQNRKFDIIILSHLLEHISNVSSFLISVRDLLADDGALLIVVPGRKNSQEKFKRSIQLAHLNYFDCKGLVNLCNNSGFIEKSSNENIEAIFEKG